MEYYGKILCISYNDLTYDDRPVMVNGKADYSRSRTLKGVHPSTLSEEELAPIMSIPNYKKLAAKEKINVVRSGRGLGGYVLVEIATMPLRFQERIKLKYGDMKEDVIRNWLGSHYHIDAKAREFYTRFRFDNGDALPPEHIQEYTVNASVIEAVMRAMEDATFMRKAMKAGPVNWGELAGAISYYQAEFGHTLPVSSNRFKKRVNDFKANGYESLISRKFMNQNRRKVTYDIERLLLSIDAQPEQPFNTTVWEHPSARHTSTIIAAVPIPFRITTADPKKIFPTACAVFPSPGSMLMVCVTDIFFRLSTEGAIIRSITFIPVTPASSRRITQISPRFSRTVILEISFSSVIQFNI